MGSVDDIDFGPDTDSIRKWLAKRATYAEDLGDRRDGGKHRSDPPPGTGGSQRVAVPDARAVGRDVLEALTAPASSAPSAPAATPAPTEPVPTDATAGPQASAQGPSPDDQATVGRSTNIVFKPRKAVRRTITTVLLLAGAATGGAAYLAYQEQTGTAIGIAAVLGLLTLVVWAVRTGTTTTELAVLRGQLELIRDGRFEVIDLASPFTPVLVEGLPGRRGWRVLVERPDRPLLVLDRTVVDPLAFSAVLYRLRPDLRPDGHAAGDLGAATPSAP